MVLKPSELSRDTKDVLIQHYIDRWVLGKGACLTSDLFGKKGWGNYVDTRVCWEGALPGHIKDVHMQHWIHRCLGGGSGTEWKGGGHCIGNGGGEGRCVCGEGAALTKWAQF